MAKKQDFASKTMKLGKLGKTCPVCNELYSTILSVNMVPAKKEGSYRFIEQRVSICKCNEQEVYA
jgi:hypothetical protein